MRLVLKLAVLAASAAVTGCRSPYVEVTISNQTGHAIELLEVDYPSASFGTQGLAPGADFHYRFKVLGSGPTKLLYTDSAHHDHKSDGPILKEGADGALAIIVAPSDVTWQAAHIVSTDH